MQNPPRYADYSHHDVESVPNGNARLRIVSGRFAGRDLRSPRGWRVRPTAERVRDALLTMLHADVEGARVLDLFAGTGALGLEAMSRGARSADFVESHPDSLIALKANVVRLRVKQRTRIFKRDAIPFSAALGAHSYDITFADPPYESRKLDLVLDAWRASHFSRILAVEHATTHELPSGAHRRVFGDTAFTIYLAKGGRNEKRREPDPG